jgi:predicted dinucleotide-binding enzyme
MTGMKIAVIGAGKIGRTIGVKWQAAGHEVVFGLRDPSKHPGARTIGDSMQGVDVVLLAVPGAAVPHLARDHARELDNRIVIDATNDFRAERFHHWDALAEASPRAQLYRVFNTYGFDVYENASLGGSAADMFYAGPEGNARSTVEQLIKDVGLEPVWVGGVDAVDTVDGVLALWFTLARRRGRRIAFKLITD